MHDSRVSRHEHSRRFHDRRAPRGRRGHLRRGRRGRSSTPAAFVAAARSTDTNERLLAALEQSGMNAVIARPALAADAAHAGDVVVVRADVLPTLDGVEPGLGRLRRLRRHGVRMVNEPDSLLACHDKLLTALLLRAASLPQPRAGFVRDPSATPTLEPPYVLKPRFGSRGEDVYRCDSRAELAAGLRDVAGRPWFRRHGAFVQELVEPLGYDLRLIVSAGEVVGAVERVAATGEWRTNVALGGRRRRVTPPRDACRLAVRAAAAVGADLVGVDLLPDGDGGWRVIELNAAVDFTDDYALDGTDVFARAVAPFVPPVAATSAGRRPAWNPARADPLPAWSP